MLPSGDTRSVPLQIDRLLKRGVQGLQFPPELEVQFERDSGAPRSRRLWREGLVSILAFNVFYIGEWLLTHQISRRELLLQLGLITPICVVVNALMRFNPPRWLREGSISFMTCVIACVYLYLQLGKGAVAVAFTLVGIIVTAMFAAVVMRLRFYFALTASIVITLAGFLFLLLDRALRADEKITGLALMSIAIGIAMMSNYSLEREERLGYLRFLVSEAHRKEVSEMNSQLAKLSSIDKLTGLPNRRSYEEHFERMWDEAMADHSPLALIVLDVDHFKVLNDVRGHSYGDEVLRRVGSLLPQALRSTADFAARFGGEEFVMLLPKTDRESAERIAERIRALIEMAGSPQQPPLPEKECLMWVTASCGISTCIPTSDLTREMLLESADKAMYQAKSAGRNRVSYRSLFEPLENDLRIPITGHVA